MAKVSIKSEKLSLFGGIYFTNQVFNAIFLHSNLRDIWNA